MSFLNDIFSGTPEVRQNVSTLRKSQEPLYRDLQNAGRGRYGKGTFGQAGQYYSDILSNKPGAFEAFAAPEVRQFNEDIIPGLSEQFAGMGSGGLESSGFRNAAVQQGQGLAERLAAMRQSLRAGAAQGLQGIGQAGLGNFSQNMVTQQGSPGLLSQIAPIAGNAAAAYFGAPPIFGGSGQRNSSPYGQQSGGISNYQR